MPVEPSMSIGYVVTLSLSSSVIGSFLTQAALHWREQTSSKREAAYLALRLATVFERYAHDAADMVNDNDNFASSRGEVGQWKAELPSLGSLPDEKERWRDLPVELTSSVLDFTPTRDTGERRIRQAYDVMDAEEASAILRTSALQLGMRALNVGRRLREAYKLPKPEESWWSIALRAEHSQVPTPPTWAELQGEIDTLKDKAAA